MTTALVEVILIGLSAGIAVLAVRRVRSLAPADPELDRLLFVISPLLWLVRRGRL